MLKVGGGGSSKKRRRRKQSSGPTPPGPFTDAERAKVEKFKASPQYRKDVREAYTGGRTTRPGVTKGERPVAERQAVVANILDKVTTSTKGGDKGISTRRMAKLPYEEKIILKEHIDRLRRSRTLARGRARSPIFPDRQRRQVTRYESAVQRAVDRTLSPEHTESVLNEERRKERDAPRLLPNTAPGGKAVEAGIAGADFGDPGDPHPSTKRAVERIAAEAFAAGATPSQVSDSLMALQTRHKSLGLHVLEQLTRVNSAVAGAAKGAATGNPLKVATGAIKGAISNKESFGKIVAGKDQKASGWEIGLGLILDIALDPTTYITAGTAAPAIQGARLAARRAAEEAATRGLGNAAIKRAAVEAAEKAWGESALKGKGVTIGLRGTPVRLGSIANQIRKGAKPLPATERVAARAEAVAGRKGARKAMAAASARVRTSRVGVAATRSTREVSSSGRGTTRLIGNRVRSVNQRVAARAEAHRVAETGSKAGGWRNFLDQTATAFVHSHRPKEFSEVEWDFMTAGAREYRAAMGVADRMGERRLQAFRDYLDEHEIPDEAHTKIIDAIEVGRIDTLPQSQRKVAEQMRDDFAEMFEMKVKAGVLEPDERIRDRTGDVNVPPRPDVKQSQKNLGKARRAAAATEKAVREAEVKLAEMEGRAQVLSRNVSGIRGERAAERAGNPRARTEGRYAGGGVGVSEARANLAMAERARADALDALAAQRKAHETVVALSQEARAARKRADTLEREATGYVARIKREDLSDGSGSWYRHERRQGWGGGAGSISGAGSTKRRVQREPLADVDPERRAQFIGDIPQIMGESTAETYRLRAFADLNDTAAALGRRIEDPDEIDLAIRPETGAPDPFDMQRFYIRTRRGELKPVYRVIDTTSQLDKRLRELVESGEEVLEVSRETIMALQSLAKRGRIHRPNVQIGGPLTAKFDEATRGWKWLVTQPNPGYHWRNLMGDLWNARLGGATLRDVNRALDMLWNTRREADGLSRDMLAGVRHEVTQDQLKHGGKRFYYKGLGGMVSDLDIVLLAERLGVARMGFAGTELRQLRRGETVRSRSRLGTGLASFNESREDLMRLASFQRGLRRGMDPQEAAKWANKHHFDYSDLTPTETNLLRRLMPFYTFLARNTPLQIASLIQTPGRFASFEKIRNASAEAAGIDPDWLEKMPKYVQAQLPFAVPQGLDSVNLPGVGTLPVTQTLGLPLMASPMLPLTDLNNADPIALGERMLSSITPFLKLPAELLFKYDTFYRDKIRKDYVPAPAWVNPKFPVTGALTAQYLKLLGHVMPGAGEPNIHKIYDRRTGKYVWAWPWWMDKLARSTPITGLAAGVATEGRDKRPGDRALTALNWLTGVRRAAIDPTEALNDQLFERLERLDEEYERIKPRVNRSKRKAGEKYGGRLGEINKERQAIREELGKATGDWAVPYYDTGKKKRKRKRPPGVPVPPSGGGFDPKAFLPPGVTR